MLIRRWAGWTQIDAVVADPRNASHVFQAAATISEVNVRAGSFGLIMGNFVRRDAPRGRTRGVCITSLKPSATRSLKEQPCRAARAFAREELVRQFDSGSHPKHLCIFLLYCQLLRPRWYRPLPRFKRSFDPPQSTNRLNKGQKAFCKKSPAPGAWATLFEEEVKAFVLLLSFRRPCA